MLHTGQGGRGRGRVLAGLEAVLRAAPRPSTAGPQPHARAGGVPSQPGPEAQEAVEAGERLRERAAGGGGCGGASGGVQAAPTSCRCAAPGWPR